MRQGEIREMYFDPVIGSEQSGRRPAVIVSGNLMSNCLSSNYKKLYRNVVLNPDERNSLKKQSEILIFHIRSVAKDRLKAKLSVISGRELVQVKQGLEDILSY